MIEKNKGPYIYNTNAFGTITISLVFPYAYNKDNIIKEHLMWDTINRSIKYKEEATFEKDCTLNGIISINRDFYAIGDTSYFEFIMTIASPKFIDINLDKCFQMLSDFIYKPYTENNAVEEKERIKYIQIHKKNAKDKMNNIKGYVNYKLVNTVGKGTKLENTIENNLDKLDTTTSKDIFDFYKKNIIENTPFVFVMGNIDKKYIESLCNKYLFKTDKKTIKISKRKNYFIKPNKCEIINENKDFFQSCAVLVYKVKDMKEEDKETLNMIEKILSFDVLYNKLRKEENLVYECSSFCKSIYGTIWLTAFINKENKEKTFTAMKDVINLLKNKDVTAPILEKIKEKERIKMIKDKDQKMCLFYSYFMDPTLEFSKVPKENYEKICNITSEDIKALANRLVLSYEYFLRGDKDAR